MRKVLSYLPLAALCISTMQAQEQKEYTNFADTTFSIQEVIVESTRKTLPQVTKLEVPMNYLPVTVNRINGNSLEIRGIRDIQDAVRFMPGVRIQTTYGAFQQLSIRGYDYSIMMIDGVRDERSAIGNSYPFMDLSSVENIEVLKGPASVLYGHSVVGGVMNIVRIAPKEETTVSARISYGSYENKQATVGMGGHLLGPINYYANFNIQDQAGWRDNATKRFSAYFAANAKITDRDLLEVRASLNRDDYSTEIGLPALMSYDIYDANTDELYLNSGDQLPGLDKEARYNNESDFMTHHAWDVSTQYTHTFENDWKLSDKFAFYYDNIDYFGTEELSYLTSDEPIYDHYYVSGGEKTYICLDSVYLSYPLRFSHIARTISNALELSGKFHTGSITHNFMGGYSFSIMNRTTYTGYDLGVDVVGPGLYSHVSVYNPQSMGYMTSSFSSATPTHHFSNSIYFQDLLDINRHWKVLIALRGDFFRYLRATADTPTGHREYDKSTRTAWNRILNKAFTYRVGAVYIPHPSTSLYASFSTFFKPIRTFYSATTIYVDGDGHRFYPTENEEVFKPESGYQAEGGIKYTLGNWLQANASVFYIRRKNSTQTFATGVQEEVDGETVTMSIVGQLGVMDSKGFDIELNFTPLNTLAFTLGYGYTDARIRDFNEIKDEDLAAIVYDTDNSSLATAESLEGNYQNNVPKNNFYAYGSYTIPKGIFKNLGVNISTSFTDKVYRNTSNTRWFDSYWLTDLGFYYTMKSNIRLSFNINNLFDKDYCNQALGQQLVPSMPRNYLASISYLL